MNIQKKKEDRFKFLHKIYEVSNGRMNIMVNGEFIGKELGFDRGYSADIYYYLNEEGLTEPMGAGIRLTLTHFGVREIEEALTSPNKQTEHFPPVFNILQIENMSGGAIQQGTNNSTISIVSNDTIKNINNYVETLEDFINNQVKTTDLKNELKADIETIKQQLQSPKPKSSIIKATLVSTKEVLIGATGGLLGTLAQPKAQELVQMIGNLLGEITS